MTIETSRPPEIAEIRELSLDELDDITGAGFWSRIAKVAAVVGITAGVVALAIFGGGGNRREPVGTNWKTPNPQ